MANENNPWAWQQWAAQQDPATYGWRNMGGVGREDLANLKPALQAAGLWRPEYDNADTAMIAETDGGGGGYVSPMDLSALSGYGVGNARSINGTTLTGYVGPDGRPITGADGSVTNGRTTNAHSSLTGGDYAVLASVPLAGLAAGAMGMGAAGSAGGAAEAGGLMSLPADWASVSVPEIAGSGATLGGGQAGALSTMGGMTAPSVGSVAAAPSGLMSLPANFASVGVPEIAGTTASLGASGTLPAGLQSALGGGSLGSGGGLLSSIGSSLSNMSGSDVLKAGTVLAGAAAGAKGTPGATATQQSQIDPRMQELLYGNGGLLNSARDLYAQNKSGVNPTMQAGWDRQLGLLRDPNTTAQLQQVQQRGMGLLGGGVAANPYSNGMTLQRRPVPGL